MNLNPIDLSRRMELLCPKAQDNLSENPLDPKSPTTARVRAFSPTLFKSPVGVSNRNLLTLSQKDQYRSVKYLRAQSSQAKINYQKVVLHKLHKAEGKVVNMTEKINTQNDTIQQLNAEISKSIT